MTVLTRDVASPWARPHTATTLGVFSLAFLFAFEALAVATVMPSIAADLDGLAWYSWAFVAPMAAAVVALIQAGPWIDRHGARPALAGGVAVFVLGVVTSGLAPSMPVFLVGRLVHGWGGGVLGVALYVLIAHAYPESLRPRVFAVLTTAWVLPALVGPAVAGVVADRFGWRWVFLGVPVLAVLAWSAVRGAPLAPGSDVTSSTDGLRWRDLVRDVVRGHRGLPAVIATRGAVGAAFAGAEAYLPLLLTLERDLSLAQAGSVLTVGAVTWSVGAWCSAHLTLMADEASRVRWGTASVVIGVLVVATAGVESVPLAVVLVGWALAGFGIGTAFSTLSVLALAAAPEGQTGRVSSALQLNDNVAQGVVLGAGSLVFAVVAHSAPVSGAVGLVVGAGLIGAIGLVTGRRVVADTLGR